MMLIFPDLDVFFNFPIFLKFLLFVKLKHASDYMYHGKTSDLAIMDERCVALYKERAENGEYNLLFQIRKGSHEHY